MSVSHVTHHTPSTPHQKPANAKHVFNEGKKAQRLAAATPYQKALGNMTIWKEKVLADIRTAQCVVIYNWYKGSANYPLAYVKANFNTLWPVIVSGTVNWQLNGWIRDAYKTLAQNYSYVRTNYNQFASFFQNVINLGDAKTLYGLSQDYAFKSEIDNISLYTSLYYGKIKTIDQNFLYKAEKGAPPSYPSDAAVDKAIKECGDTIASLISTQKRFGLDAHEEKNLIYAATFLSNLLRLAGHNALVEYEKVLKQEQKNGTKTVTLAAEALFFTKSFDAALLHAGVKNVTSYDISVALLNVNKTASAKRLGNADDNIDGLITFYDPLALGLVNIEDKMRDDKVFRDVLSGDNAPVLRALLADSSQNVSTQLNNTDAGINAVITTIRYSISATGRSGIFVDEAIKNLEKFKTAIEKRIRDGGRGSSHLEAVYLLNAEAELKNIHSPGSLAIQKLIHQLSTWVGEGGIGAIAALGSAGVRIKRLGKDNLPTVSTLQASFGLVGDFLIMIEYVVNHKLGVAKAVATIGDLIGVKFPNSVASNFMTYAVPNWINGLGVHSGGPIAVYYSNGVGDFLGRGGGGGVANVFYGALGIGGAINTLASTNNTVGTYTTAGLQLWYGVTDAINGIHDLRRYFGYHAPAGSSWHTYNQNIDARYPPSAQFVSRTLAGVAAGAAAHFIFAAG